MPFYTDTPNLSLRWDKTGGWDGHPAETRLTAHIRIEGADLHVDAIEVRHGADRIEAVHPAFEQDLDSMAELLGDGDFTTSTIEGREYVIRALPFCN
jgi:hypothetical protein